MQLEEKFVNMNILYQIWTKLCCVGDEVEVNIFKGFWFIEDEVNKNLRDCSSVLNKNDLAMKKFNNFLQFLL